MKYNNETIDWVINRIETEYKGEISILLGRVGAGKVPGDEQKMEFDFFIPACDHGYTLARNFIIGDMGYDLYPMSWERVEGIAALNERITFCLADSEILYARNEADREKFEILRKTLFNNLKNEDFRYKKALEKINYAMDIYKNMMFEKYIGRCRKAADGIIQYLCEAISTVNGTYLTRDYEFGERINKIKQLEKVPSEFIKNYEEILQADNIQEISKYTHSIINCTREFFENLKPENKNNNFDFNSLAGWYEESRYTFRRIAYACDNNQYDSAFTWGGYIQVELDILAEEAELDDMDLLGAYDRNDLSKLKKRVQEIEGYILDIIDEYNVSLNKYDTVEDFLKYQK